MKIDAYRIEEVWDVLSPQEKAVIQGHYFEEKPFKQLAKELGVSRSYPSKLAKQALLRMRLRFEKIDKLDWTPEIIDTRPSRNGTAPKPKPRPAPKPKPEPKRPTKHHKAWVKSAMAAMKAFLRGEKIQMRGQVTTGGYWQDVDLGELIDRETAIDWRPKPK
jgi:Sigma-70, region 4